MTIIGLRLAIGEEFIYRRDDGSPRYSRFERLEYQSEDGRWNKIPTVWIGRHASEPMPDPSSRCPSVYVALDGLHQCDKRKGHTGTHQYKMQSLGTAWNWVDENMDGKELMSDTTIKVGDYVDFHSVIGGPITLRHRRVYQTCDDFHGRSVAWISGKAGCVAVEALTPSQGEVNTTGQEYPRCPYCGNWESDWRSQFSRSADEVIDSGAVFAEQLMCHNCKRMFYFRAKRFVTFTSCEEDF